MSNTRYTNNWIRVDFLKHFIKHTKSSSTSRYKMLLFNSAESYETDEFKQLALNYNIILFR